ncbi:MAG: crotonase/enoyl-CoA hydratase family protein [Acidimicrobiales bacterium]|jgi:enoyl-CoA hydratase|nr:crotonase/enoyl-CoA hydratase family protein [Acidimicrobiaceae bacterium]MBT5569386.1 crotonase/enoyl-CoA hydratase family protein [Acidimicrobiaceae bacterium]MBT6092792.1 crotonase/enoyl-CoA hydratase family protein [Acidimicrobiaceae bacterium]MDG2159968.1 crotonase/enoyl-CoA hydratase family protein [Acidimicrobiales bacterium]
MTVDFEIRDRIAIITLNRPEARNAVSQQLAEDLESAIDRLEADEALWIGILCGNGPAFCAGADLKAIASGEARLTTKRGGFAGLVRRVRTKPLIAAVEGPAVAGGTEIVLSCDLVVASTTARFGLPEVKRSLVANAGGLFRLPRALPVNVAMEMALTGDDLDAEAAHRHGLVNRLVQPGHALATALELAEAVNANAPLAVRASRRVVLAARLLEDDEAFEVAANATREVFRTEDFREGPRAFVEKRPPIWTGR